jgi:hypothetical protein
MMPFGRDINIEYALRAARKPARAGKDVREISGDSKDIIPQAKGRTLKGIIMPHKGTHEFSDMTGLEDLGYSSG